MARGPVRKYPIAEILRAAGAEIGNYRSGKQKIRCPYHDDTRPSAQVDFTNQRFRCWSCDASGDALDLLITQEGLNWDAAIDRAEALAGGAPEPVRAERREDPGLFGRPRTGGRR